MKMVGILRSMNVDPNNPHSEKVPVLVSGQYGLILSPATDQVHNKLLTSLDNGSESSKSVGVSGEIKEDNNRPYIEVTALWT